MRTLALLAFFLPSLAAALETKEPAHVTAALVADVETLAPGRPFRLGVRLIHAPGWHTYWKEPGDSGMATRIDWALPPGFAAGPLEWPAPARHEESGLVTNVYFGETTLSARVTPP